ncbi:hypothetical protein JKP88DRAFT_298822 [Tribonema minus]|uniref:Uncharacterized protein n=1 Tax=Tribonema minus TaxID=303371 RepID=A0A835ZBC1_9STRA|nr:hypothetical protein JKP88DRAFT_298822 [Tribonema minus]
MSTRNTPRRSCDTNQPPPRWAPRTQSLSARASRTTPMIAVSLISLDDQLAQHPLRHAAAAPAHRRALEREAACCEALLRATARRCGLRRALPLRAAVDAFQRRFQKYLQLLREGITVNLIENLQRSSPASPPPPPTTLGRTRKVVRTAGLQCVRCMLRPAGCFMIETEDEVLGAFQALSVEDLSALALGLMSVASALHHEGRGRGSSGTAAAPPPAGGNLLWQGARLCISQLAEGGECSDGSEEESGGGDGAMPFAEAVAWVQATLGGLLEAHPLGGAVARDLRIRVDSV